MIVTCAIASIFILWYVSMLIECMKIADEEVDEEVRTVVKAMFIIASPILIPVAFIRGAFNGIKGGMKSDKSERHNRETETDSSSETDNIRHREDS